MKTSLLVIFISLSLSSCSATVISSNFAKKTLFESSAKSNLDSTSNTQLNSAKPLVANVDQTFLISSQGIGKAKLGTTLKQLKQELGNKAEFKVVSPFMVDIDAIAISESGKIQFYILYPSGTMFADSNRIETLLTDNSNFRTAEGIGPNTPLKQAEKIYGKAILFYNTMNESREYVKFAKQPATNISFKAKDKNHEFAGIYSTPLGEYNETKQFHESAYIDSVLIQK